MARRSSVPLIIAILVLIIALVLAIHAAVQSKKLWLPTPLLALTLSLAIPPLTLLSLFLPGQHTARALPSSGNVVLPDLGGRRSFRACFDQLHLAIPTQQQAQFILILLTTVLLTLSSSEIMRRGIVSCLLQSRWRELFSARNAEAIKSIQDALSCCGFRNAREWAWPFQGRGVGNDACLLRYAHEPGRDQGCEARLEANMRGVDGSMIAAAVAALLVQMLLLYMNRSQNSKAGNTLYDDFSEGRIVDEDDGIGTNSGRFLDDPTGSAGRGATVLGSNQNVGDNCQSQQ